MNIRKDLLVSVISLGIFFGLVQGAEAANHYIRAGATGSSPCTAGWGDDQACNTLPASLTRGDTYYIADGSYSGRTFNTAASGSTYITIKKATASDHGTDTGWQSSYGDGQATFSGQLYFGSSYWILDGVTGGGPGSWNTGFGFKVTETGSTVAIIKIGNTSSAAYNNIIIRHIELQGKGSAGGGGSQANDAFAIYGGSSITVSYAYTHGIGRCPVFGYDQGVLLFEYVYFLDFYGSDGGHAALASLGQNGLEDCTFRYCLFGDAESTGGIMWNSENNTNAHLYIYGNVFYKASDDYYVNPIYNGVIGGWGGYPFRNVLVYNNTFIDINRPILGTLNVPSGNIAYNNIFYNCTSPTFDSFATHDYNHFINSGGTHSEAHGTTAASGDPFVDYVNFNFALNGATAAGMPLSSPLGIALDPLGYTRGSDGTWDRGAFEYLSGPPQSAYTLTVVKSGSGSGTVTGTGIDCGSDCTETIATGNSVTLTASADADSVFSGWSGGGCSGTGACTVIMNSNTTVTASFNQSEAPSELIEAETGTLVSPIQIVSDSQASGGQYIQTSTSESGTATYTFNIPTTGIYKIVARVYAANLGQDSLFFQIDSQAEDTWDFNPPETSEGYNLWREDELTKRGTGTVNNPQYDPYTLELTQGNHTITFRGREVNAKLDYFRFAQTTTDTTPPAAPTGLQVN